MATNRIDILDPALLRPGRIDRKIEFPNVSVVLLIFLSFFFIIFFFRFHLQPNEDGRLHILKIHSRKMNLMRGIDLKKIADSLVGASGAEIKAVTTEAGMV